jgi:hypothetical protein
LSSRKRKAELAVITPAKALKAGAILMMRTLADDVAWVTKFQVAMEWLKAKEAIIKAGMSAWEGTEAGDAARELERVETAPGTTKLDGSESGGHELGSTERTPEAIEAGNAETFARDAGQAGRKETEEVVETPQDAGKELEGQR